MPTTPITHQLRQLTPELASYPDDLLADLAMRYAEPHRHYHTLDHIGALLALLAQHRPLAHDTHAIAAAICFHDAVYDTHRQDNEARSAELARTELARLGWHEPATDKVVALVLATQHHDAALADADAQLFLDFDLSILAADPALYDAYAAAVRREYAWVPERAYAQGRSAVLQGFLAREHIFRTPALHALWDAPARANLARELSALSGR